MLELPFEDIPGDAESNVNSKAAYAQRFRSDLMILSDGDMAEKLAPIRKLCCPGDI